MSEHPVLSKRLHKELKRLLKRSSRRGASARSLAVSGSVSRRSAKTASSVPKKARISDVSAPQKAELKPLAEQKTAEQKKGELNLKQPVKGVQPPLAKSSKTGKFWSDLFLVRPWMLVGGLWLTSVGMIAIALIGLSNPGREMVLEPVSSSIEGQPLSGPDTAAVSRLAPGGDGAVRRDPAATLPGTAEQTMPTWPLLLMVAACAGGCMMMSNQRTLINNSRRGRRRMAGDSPRPVKAAAAKHQATGGRRRARHRRLNPQRPASQVMAFRTGQQIRHTPPQRPAAAAKPVSFAVKREVASQVSVVPETETSPLDWKEGSLAHKLDVRQTRSINSFL